MKRIILVVLTCCACALAQPPPPAATTDAETAIGQLREGLIESFFKGDIDRVLTYLAPDVLVTWQNGEVSRGTEEVKTYYNRMMTGPDRIVREIKAQPVVEGRQVYGDWVVSWGALQDHFVLSDGRELSLNSRFTITTAKLGDRWLVMSYHASVNAFDNSILALAIKKSATWAALGGALLGLIIAFAVSRARRPKAPAAVVA